MPPKTLVVGLKIREINLKSGCSVSLQGAPTNKKNMRNIRYKSTRVQRFLLLPLFFWTCFCSLNNTDVTLQWTRFLQKLTAPEDQYHPLHRLQDFLESARQWLAIRYLYPGPTHVLHCCLSIDPRQDPKKSPTNPHLWFQLQTPTATYRNGIFRRNGNSDIISKHHLVTLVFWGQ